MAIFRICKLLTLGQSIKNSSVINRLIFSTPILFNNMDKFEEAKKKLADLKEEPDNQNKLKLYALFKQATVGQCNAQKPGMMDFVRKAKFEAWSALGNLKQEDAQLKYVQFVEALLANQQSDPNNLTTKTTTAIDSLVTDDVLVTIEGKITLIKLNRPTKKNALVFEMYRTISKTLAKAATDNSSIVVITGTGDFYCSGNDLSNFMVDPSTIDKVASDAKLILEKFVGSFIDFPKPLVALVNGPAVGIAVTLLGLCDVVYASDSATFHTPFSSLGQSPEGCSSITFPAIMGTSMASEVLLFGHKLSAKDALNCGLVSRVFPSSSFQTDAWESVKKLSSLPPQSMKLSKCLTRDAKKQALHSANKRECELLESRWKSEECMNAIMSFFQKKTSKL